MSESTIAAISTPTNATGGLSVIRISGEKSIETAEKIFTSVKDRKVCDMAGYTCAYGKISDGDEYIDDAVLTVFRKPHSYTGEDTVEISCHGGIYVTNRILRTILKNGAELAQAGEFTKRAYMNGKMSLNQAEAVMNIISAKSESELRYAGALREESTFRGIADIKQKITAVLGDLSAWSDYPDEDIPEVSPQQLESTLENIENIMKKTLDGYDNGRIIREGINAVIAGRPNVGKSTLMNVLSGFERSIVTDIAGTTRDVIEESVKLGRLVLRLSDTAGIRTTEDKIEEKGVDIAYKRVNQADLVFAVFDGSRELDAEDRQLAERLSGKKAIAVINKSDKENRTDKEYLESKFQYSVEISAKERQGIEELENTIEKMFLNGDIEQQQMCLANERQRNCLERSYKSVSEALYIHRMGENLDAVTVVLDEALSALLELTGERITETVANEVFSRFCVGK